MPRPRSLELIPLLVPPLGWAHGGHFGASPWHHSNQDIQVAGAAGLQWQPGCPRGGHLASILRCPFALHHCLRFVCMAPIFCTAFTSCQPGCPGVEGIVAILGQHLGLMTARSQGLALWWPFCGHRIGLLPARLSGVWAQGGHFWCHSCLVATRSSSA